MKNLFYYILLTFFCFLTEIPSYAQKAENNSFLVPVGGGTTNADVMKAFMSLSKKHNPVILIIPYATDEKNTASSVDRSTAMFTKMGFSNINSLDLSDKKRAIELVNNCDIIWMPGGSQLKLRKVLENANLTEAILKKYKAGNLVVGGTSAGASVMSDVMMAGNERDQETKLLNPVLSYGLKLWPEVIIDQHFSQRNRLGRLRKAIEKNKNLLGIGIDESTGVLYNNDGKITVVGKGTVTFIRTKKTADNKEEINETVLTSGQSYLL